MTTTCLLDVNVLVALTWPSHVHHEKAHAWFAAAPERSWATCALTELGFVRVSSNAKLTPDAVDVGDALHALSALVGVPGHVFWADAPAVLAFEPFRNRALAGHRQLTDAYLACLAHMRGGRLATLDRPLARWAVSARLPIELIDG